MDGPGAALNPCSAHARAGMVAWGRGWLGARHDVTRRRLGVGLQERSEGLPGGNDVQEVHAGGTRHGPTSDAPPETQLLLCLPVPNSTSCPDEESWWSGLVIIVAVCCAALVFLTVLVIICYKAIK
ncbi:Hypothetical predicted protein, partial [Marmota monax]